MMAGGAGYALPRLCPVRRPLRRNRTFLIKIAIFAILPLFSMVAAGVPAVGQLLFGWLVPMLKIMQ
jgi:hypothetical protein